VKNYRAIFFDFDGVITNTEPVHFEAWKEVLAAEKICLSHEEFSEHYVGINDRDLVEKTSNIHQRTFSPSEKENLITAKVNLSISILRKNGIPLFDGIKETLATLSQSKKLCIVTGCHRKELELILESTGINSSFQFWIPSDLVTHGKPHPEGYQLAFEKMKSLCKWEPELKKEECLVIEDSINGVKAAKKAGFPCLGVTTSSSKEELHEADMHAKSVLEFFQHH